MISKDKYIENGIKQIQSDLYFSQTNCEETVTCNILSYVYDTVIQPELIMKVVRSDEAKEFPMISIKKDGDVGYDLPSIVPEDNVNHCRELLLFPHEKIKVATGIRFQIPDGYWIELKARSGTGQLAILTPDAVIDEKYRGEIFPVLMNVGTERVVIRHGERYIQAIIHKKHNDRLKIVEVDEIDTSDRGETGFGSTGR